MWGWLNTLLEKLDVCFPGRPARAKSPRLPRTLWEAKLAYRHYDAMNGRYFFVADVALDSGAFLRDVVFDKDTNIAVTVKGMCFAERPELAGRNVVALLITDDQGKPLVTEEVRRRFAEDQGCAGETA